MAENKTKATAASVEAYLGAIADASRRRDCETLVRIMRKATGEKPVLWGTAIVGFGSLHYRYDSGREGDICLVGFAARKNDISVYGTAAAPQREALLAKLGKHKTGKGCLYLGKLEDVDLRVLEQLIVDAVAARAV